METSVNLFVVCLDKRIKKEKKVVYVHGMYLMEAKSIFSRESQLICISILSILEQQFRK